MVNVMLANFLHFAFDQSRRNTDNEFGKWVIKTAVGNTKKKG